MGGDPRRDQHIEPYKHSPRANSRTNLGPNVHSSTQGVNKMSATSLSKAKDAASLKSSVKSNKRTPTRKSQKGRKKHEADQPEIMKIDDEFRNNYHASNLKKQSMRKDSHSRPETSDEPKYTNYQ